jgi:hypothetical protein
MIDPKTINEHCQAGKYLTPKNMLCAQAMEKFNIVRIKLL